MLQAPNTNLSAHPFDKAPAANLSPATRRSSRGSTSAKSSIKSSNTPPPPASSSSALSSMITAPMDAKLTAGMKDTITRNNAAATAAATSMVAKPPLPPPPTKTATTSSPRSVASSVRSSTRRTPASTTAVVKKSQRSSETSISLAGMRAKMQTTRAMTKKTKHGASMNTIDRALDHHQKRSLLDDLDKLATHLPATVLDQVVKQVVLENNESQVWSLLGKSIEFTKKISNSQANNEQGKKKAKASRRKLPKRSRSIRSMISKTSIDSHSHGNSDSHSSVGMTLDSDSDSEHNDSHDDDDSDHDDSEHDDDGNGTTDDDDDDDDDYSLSDYSVGSGLHSNTSSMADDMTWAVAGTTDEEDDTDSSEEDEDTGTIGRGNLSHAGLLLTTTRSSQRSCAGKIETRRKRFSESERYNLQAANKSNQPTKKPVQRRKSDTNLMVMLEEDKRKDNLANNDEDENTEDKEVAKLCQGRLSSTMLNEDTNNSFHESITNLSNHESLHSGGTAAHEAAAAAASLVAANAANAGKKRLASTSHTSALLFVDISGFTKLSRSLEVEQLSKVINSYFQKIVEIIHAYNGDVLKFAGDALLVEWKDKTSTGMKNQAPFLAAICAARLVDACSDFQVKIPSSSVSPASVASLNLHCAIGYGQVRGMHLGTNVRMEYVICGEALGQIEKAMQVADLGEVVASPETIEVLRDVLHFTIPENDKAVQQGQPQVIARKAAVQFVPTNPKAYASIQLENTNTPLSSKVERWDMGMLQRLHDRIRPYVHRVVLNHLNAAAVPTHGSGTRRMSSASANTLSARRNSSHASLASMASNTSAVATSATEDAELRDVLTIFLQPILPDTVDLMSAKVDSEDVVDLLQKIFIIIQSEIQHNGGHMRQFIVDDKGLVIIINFGLRGSTFPNMVEERTMPCMMNIRTLLRTELSIDSRIGATTGKAYCGVVGAMFRGEYSVLGPSVNLAARLMGNKDNPGVLVDRSFRIKARTSPFRVRKPISAKGYDRPVRIYEPKQGVRKAWAQIPDDEFVGRSHEVSQLTVLAADILGTSEIPKASSSSSSSKLVFISAPYGYGKSCLLSHGCSKIEALCRQRSASYHVTRHVFSEDDSFQPFSLVRPLFLDILRRNAGGDSNTACPADEALKEEHRKQEEASFYLQFLQNCLQAGIPMQYIEMFAAMIFSDKLSDDIGKWSDKNQKMSEWTTLAKHLVRVYLQMTSNYNLVLLALDDLTGMDEMSWLMLRRLISVSRNSCKFLILGTARNEYGLNMQRDSSMSASAESFSYMRLEPMPEDEITQLTIKRSSCEREAKKNARTVYFLSEGNPFLACEILDNLYSTDSSASSTAEGVQEILLNRLDSLPSSVRLLLQCCSMLGESFSLSDVLAVMEKYYSAEDDLASHADMICRSLEEAEQNGFLSSTKMPMPGVVIYTFSHVLWRKAISQQILQEWKDKMQGIIQHVLVRSNGSSAMSNNSSSNNNNIVEKPSLDVPAQLQKLQDLHESLSRLEFSPMRSG